MQVVDHPLLLSFHESIQTRTHIYIITELVEGGDLFDYVQSHEQLQEWDAAKITQQLIVGLIYLHSLEIVHRDLKPENIMVVTNKKSGEVEYVKVIDFGFSNYLSKLNQASAESNLCGTPNYIAPQVLKKQSIGFAIDNFAVGVILFFMLTHSLPFNDYQLNDILENTKHGLYQFPPEVPISNQAKDLIDALIKNDPEQRITLKNALKHPWFGILGKPRKENIH